MADDEWDIPALLAEHADVPTLLVRKSDLVHHFNDEGQLTGRVEFLVTGNVQHCISAMQAQGLPGFPPEAKENARVLTLKPADLSFS